MAGSEQRPARSRDLSEVLYNDLVTCWTNLRGGKPLELRGRDGKIIGYEIPLLDPGEEDPQRKEVFRLYEGRVSFQSEELLIEAPYNRPITSSDGGVVIDAHDGQSSSVLQIGPLGTITFEVSSFSIVDQHKRSHEFEYETGDIKMVLRDASVVSIEKGWDVLAHAGGMVSKLSVLDYTGKAVLSRSPLEIPDESLIERAVRIPQEKPRVS